jgi:hypothetical protein
MRVYLLRLLPESSLVGVVMNLGPCGAIPRDERFGETYVPENDLVLLWHMLGYLSQRMAPGHLKSLTATALLLSNHPLFPGQTMIS